jgi:endonuclease YncB( thermonuclease family)
MRCIIGIMLACYSLSGWADWSGKVVGISDGDTLTALRSGKGVKIRLVEIDAPESRQDFGEASKKSLSDMCFGKTATVIEQGSDKYGRTLGRVSCDGIDVNAEQVKRGMAWFYTQYGHDPALQAAEAQAKAAGVGLWSRVDAIPPWEFRHGGKAKPVKAAKAIDEEESSGAGCGGKSTCGQMSSCSEARHYLNDCGLTKLDRDHDGIPCESLCR